jgi:copper chaperone NosL
MSHPRLLSAAIVLAVLTAGGCVKDKTAGPPPQELTSDAVAVFCGMTVIDHPGPKGQVFLKSSTSPLWFSSVRDVIAYTLLPEEPKDIAAIYVNDMGRANWDHPEPKTWIDARTAFYVIESSRMSGMAAAEAVPFADRAAANAFAEQYGGRVVALADVPASYVLGDGDASSRQQAEGAKP